MTGSKKILPALVGSLLLAGPVEPLDDQAGAQHHSQILRSELGGDLVEATYNLWIDNPRPRHDLEIVIDRAQLIRLQEITTRRNKAAVEELLTTHPSYAAYWPRSTGLVILWDTRVLEGAGPGGRLLVVPRVQGMPRRWTIWKPLRLRATGDLLMVVDVHAIAHGCQPGLPLRQRAAAQHWQTIKGATATWTTSYAAVLLGGDFNCRLDNPAWWAPGPVLARQYQYPTRRAGIDHLLLTRHTHLEAGPPRSTRAGLHSDHPLLWRRISR